MSADTAVQDNAPQTSSARPANVGDDTIVSLSYMHDGHESDPLPLLRIPHECMKLYSFKPRKWLRFLATNICGAQGSLRFLNGGEDLTDQEMEEDVNPGDRYVFWFDEEANFLDWLMRGTRHDKSTPSSRSCVVPRVLKEFYGGCPFSQQLPELCDACHLVPFAKGDEYLRRLLAARGEPDDTMTIDDYQNMIMMRKDLHAAFDISKSIAFLKTPNKFLKTNEVPGGENAHPDIYRVTVHCFLGSKKHRDRQNHGAHSDMTQGSGLDEPPPEGITVVEYRPKDILLDVTYAFTVLYCFGSTRAKEMLQKRAEKDHYPGGIVKKGEDREGKEEREQQKRKREKDAQDRGDRASRRSRTSENSGGQANEDEKEFDFWDWVLAMTYKFKGIRPEDIKAVEERRTKEMEEDRAERFTGWRETVDESHRNECDDDVECSGLNKEDAGLDACDAYGEIPVSIEEALSRSPPSYSIPPAMTYSSSTASDDSIDVAASESDDGDEQGIEVALHGDKRPASLDLNVSENTPDIEDARKRRRHLTEDEDILTPTHS